MDSNPRLSLSQSDTPRTTHENGNGAAPSPPLTARGVWGKQTGSARSGGARGHEPEPASDGTCLTQRHPPLCHRRWQPLSHLFPQAPAQHLLPRARLGLQNPSRTRWETGREEQTLNPLHPNTFPALVLKLRSRGSEHILKNGWNIISEAYWNSPLPEPCYSLGPWVGRQTHLYLLQFASLD